MSECRGCGKTIVWIDTRSADGSRIVQMPLDPRAPVYVVRKVGEGDRAAENYMVSHFATCPKASEMSKQRTAFGEKKSGSESRSPAKRK